MLPFRRIAAAAALTVAAVGAHASVITLVGDRFDVRYDTDDIGLFGAPTFTADGKTLVLSPTTFILQAADGDSDHLASAIRLQFIPHSGVRLRSVVTEVRGDYFREVVSGEPAPEVSASADVSLTDQSSQLATLNLTGGPFDQLNVNADWEAGGVLSATGLADGELTYHLALDLAAQTHGLGDLATIEAKTGLIDITPTTVPAPTLLSLVALIGAGVRQRKGERSSRSPR